MFVNGTTISTREFSIFIYDGRGNHASAVEFLRCGLKEDMAALLNQAGIVRGHWKLQFETWKSISNNGPKFSVKNAGLNCVFILYRPGKNGIPAVFSIRIARDATYQDGTPVTAESLREKLLRAVNGNVFEVEQEPEEEAAYPPAKTITEEEARDVLQAVRDSATGRENGAEWECRGEFLSALCKELGPEQKPERWGPIVMALTCYGLLADRGTHWGLTKLGEGVRAGTTAMPELHPLDAEPAPVSFTPPVPSLNHATNGHSSSETLFNQATKLRQALKALDDVEAAQQLVADLDGRIADVKNQEVEVIEDTRRRIDAIRLEHDQKLAELQSQLVELAEQRRQVEDGVAQVAMLFDPKMLRELADRVESASYRTTASVKGG